MTASISNFFSNFTSRFQPEQNQDQTQKAAPNKYFHATETAGSIASNVPAPASCGSSLNITA